MRPLVAGLLPFVVSLSNQCAAWAASNPSPAWVQGTPCPLVVSLSNQCAAWAASNPSPACVQGTPCPLVVSLSNHPPREAEEGAAER